MKCQHDLDISYQELAGLNGGLTTLHKLTKKFVRPKNFQYLRVGRIFGIDLLRPVKRSISRPSSIFSRSSWKTLLSLDAIFRGTFGESSSVDAGPSVIDPRRFCAARCLKCKVQNQSQAENSSGPGRLWSTILPGRAGYFKYWYTLCARLLYLRFMRPEDLFCTSLYALPIPSHRTRDTLSNIR